MLTRVYFKNSLSFNEVDLHFDKGINVFTGPSGAGKSVLMQTILSLFALSEVKSDLAEIVIANNFLENELYDISKGDDIVIKVIKKDKIRYFLNNQSISKKALYEFSLNLIKHLSLKDSSDFSNSKLVEFLDKLSQKNSIEFKNIKEEFDSKYKEFTIIKKDLEKIYNDEKKIEDLKEFTKFEIEKIDSINPSINEYEELNEIKKRLAKKDKIQEAIKKASGIMQYSNSVNTALELLEIQSSFFDDTINELNNIFEKFNDSLMELEDTNIENVLDRIEKLSTLQKKFGSIKEALEYKENKKRELENYENISFEKNKLEKNLNILELQLDKLAKQISQYRQENANLLEEKINYYLNFLYLNDAKLIFNQKKLDFNGIDNIEFSLNGVDLNKISSGEFNRLRLSLLSSISQYDIIDKGILFLDEIDANLSGKESEAIAKVLLELSKNYQIFAISHQIQLTSVANQHFLVEKNQNISSVSLLTKNESIKEIARMISGEKITKDALEFAKKLSLIQ